MGHSILQPKPLDEWVRLLDRTALPVHTGQKERVQRVMSNPNSSIGEISRAISEAPSIALIMFREANRSRSSLSEPAHNLDTVLKRLGTARCIHLLSSLMDESSVPIPANLRQVWLMGQHANRHANALFAHKMARLWQEIHWGSLLFFSPVWPLLTRHPELFDIWEQRVLGNQEPARNVERELLGVPLVKLCHALAEHWSLPQWIIDGYATMGSNTRIMARALHLSRLHERPLEQQRRLDEQKDLNSWLNKPGNSIVLASGLALASHNSWGDRHSLRWQWLLSLYLQRPLPAIQQKIHQTSVEHARYLGHTNLWHPARALLWPWNTRRIQAQVAAKQSSQPAATRPATENAVPAESPQPGINLPLWREQAQQLLVRPSPFRNSLQLLNHFIQLFQHGALDRVLVLGIDATTGTLTPVCQLGYELDPGQSLPDPASNPVFRHVTEKRKSLHIHDGNYSKVADHLNRDFLALLNSRNMLLGSIHHKDRPVLLVLADAWGQPMQAESLRAFNASNRYLEQALALRSH